MTTSTMITDLDALKQKLQRIWTAGDYDRFSRYLEGGAREFYERLPIAPGATLLDVGCGSGQLALLAAKDGLEVTGVDIAPNWVERARARAQAEGLRGRAAPDRPQGEARRADKPRPRPGPRPLCAAHAARCPPAGGKEDYS